jgi:hypothetical protein
MREMPIGVQSFRKLREEGYVYVDKTETVYSLARVSTPFFLSRPRRFGKSLLISTLDAFFSGKRELFEGLAIAELEQEWQTYPIIRIDLNGADYNATDTQIEIVAEDGTKAIVTLDALNEKLNQILSEYETVWGRLGTTESVQLRFQNLIKQIAATTDKNVVVLIDEYDKPLLETLHDEARHNRYRNTLRAFYGVLKSVDAHLRFVLITGVTKFSKVSIFSDMNQLRDISLEDSYSAVCGITEQELQDTFKPEIQALADANELSYDGALDRLKEEYDGYHFSKSSLDIYNPFSVLNTFAKQEFSDYWFETGTPTYLINMIKQTDFDILQFQNDITADVDTLTNFRIGGPNPVPVLFQSGYLTIKGYDRTYDEYTLGFPNKEVRQGFLKALLPIYLEPNTNPLDFDTRKFVKDLDAQDISALITRLQSLFAKVPFGENSGHEHYYQSILYIIFTMMSQFITVEEHTYKGRSDAVVQTKDAIFIFEFKLSNTDGDKAVKEALQQIEDSGYADAYAASPKKLYKIGVQFDPEARNITNWHVAGELSA